MSKEKFEQVMLSDEEIKQLADRVTKKIENSTLLIAGGAGDVNGHVYEKLAWQGDIQVLYFLVSRIVFSLIEEEVEENCEMLPISEICYMVMRDIGFGVLELICEKWGKQVTTEINRIYGREDDDLKKHSELN